MQRTFVWGAVLSGAILPGGTAAAQTVPAGWKTVTDMRKVCQIAVPADWTPDTLLKSMAISPDKKANVVEFDFLRKQNLVECENAFREYILANKYDYQKVRMLTYLVYLNIAALHHYPYSTFLFYLGKSGIAKILDEK